MSKKYNRIEDFVSDESFVNFCFEKNEEDIRYWRTWLADHPDRSTVFHEAREWVFLMGIRIPAEKKEEAWDKLMEKGIEAEEAVIRIEQPRKKRFGVLAALVIAGLLLAGGWYLMKNAGQRSHDKVFVQSEEEPDYKVFETGKGEQLELQLRDGTKIKLNADSRLEVESDLMNDSLREVNLEGEAYFEVEHEEERPFIVHTGDMDIRVLGTTFNVKSYEQDRLAEAVLIEGSIEVKLLNDTVQSIRLKPKEKITVSHLKRSSYAASGDSPDVAPLIAKKEVSVMPVEMDPMLDSTAFLATAWVEGRLAFRDRRFEELAKEMERKYGMEFQFENEKLKGYRFTGIFSKETLEEALEALKLTSRTDSFEFTINENGVYIME